MLPFPGIRGPRAATNCGLCVRGPGWVGGRLQPKRGLVFLLIDGIRGA